MGDELDILTATTTFPKRSQDPEPKQNYEPAFELD
jgi:hypothetical protein